MTKVAKLQMILELIKDKDEEGNPIEPLLQLTNEEIIEILNSNLIEMLNE